MTNYYVVLVVLLNRVCNPGGKSSLDELVASYNVVGCLRIRSADQMYTGDIETPNNPARLL